MKTKITSRRKQSKLIFICWFVYTMAYLGRYSYNANIIPIRAEFGIDKATAGLVTTFFFISYGIGQIVNGIFCKRYNKRLVLTVALIISAAINLIYFFGVDFRFVKYMWFINGAVQSVLWSSLVSALSDYLDADNLKTSVLVMSTPVAIGTAITYGASALFVEYNIYRYSFLLGAVALVAAAIGWFKVFGRFKSEGKNVKDELVGIENVKSKNGLVKGMTFFIIIFCALAVVDNFVKDGLQTWVPEILKENFRLPDSASIFLTLLLPVLGVFGATFCVILQKKVKSPIILNVILFGLTTILTLVIVLMFDTPFWIPILLVFGLINLLTHAINNVLTSITPLYLRKSVDSGFMAGVVNGFCYVGSAISSYGLGLIADGMGWSAVFTVFLIACGVAVVISIFSHFFFKAKGVKFDLE